MSGSGGSGGGGGGGGGGLSSSPIQCSKLVIRTTLNSPIPKVVSKLKKGDELEVELVSPKGPVVVNTGSGDRAGSITAKELLDLIRCLSEGYEYIAIVQGIAGGQVKVEIRPASK